MLKITEMPQVEIDKWYAIAIGEIGIPPHDFYQMTEEELKLAYKGYQQRLEDQTNLFLLALVRSQSNNKHTLFKLTEDLGYEIGDLQEREKVFNKLNL